jgi:hypothetical protein
MGKHFCLRRELFDKRITAYVTPLDEGIHVLLVGGDTRHVGAVSLAQNGKLLQTVSYPTHKEQVIAEKWAIALSQKSCADVTVACGIHYDDLSREGIAAVVAQTDRMLADILQHIISSHLL